jgi:uncharacterized protein YjiS (DUF1127 family)
MAFIRNFHAAQWECAEIGKILAKLLLYACKNFVAALQQLSFCSAPSAPISCSSNPAISGERNNTMLLAIIRFLHAWKRYGSAVKELSTLSDRELADIGITRSDIPRLAWEHAHA